MIRSTKPDDTTALLDLARAIGFSQDELETLKALLVDHFDTDGSRASFWLTDDDEDDGPVGVAYCEPERMTDRTWNLQLIAIHPDRQGQGRGGKLLSRVEETLKASGARMLLVETLASLDRARSFYRKHGYEEEARVRDFYAAGDDKLVFRKVLGAD